MNIRHFKTKPKHSKLYRTEITRHPLLASVILDSQYTVLELLIPYYFEILIVILIRYIGRFIYQYTYDKPEKR